MFRKSTWHQYILVLTLTSLIAVDANPKRVNCRKYVFAPICRGVAAKRIIDDPYNEMLGEDPRVYMDDKLFSQLENENEIKQKASQGHQWFPNERKQIPSSFLELRKKLIADPDDDAYFNHGN